MKVILLNVFISIAIFNLLLFNNINKDAGDFVIISFNIFIFILQIIVNLLLFKALNRNYPLSNVLVSLFFLQIVENSIIVFYGNELRLLLSD